MTADGRARMSALAGELTAISAEHSGTCTWALTDLESGEHIGHREDETMPPASLAKLPILVALYRAVEEGGIRLDDRITYEEHHRSLGSGVLARMSFGVGMSVRDAATLWTPRPAVRVFAKGHHTRIWVLDKVS